MVTDSSLINNVISNKVINKDINYISEKSSDGSELVDRDTLEELTIVEGDLSITYPNIFFQAQVGKFMNNDFVRKYLRPIKNYKYRLTTIPEGDEGKVPTVEQGDNPHNENEPVVTILLKYEEVKGVSQIP